MAIPSVYIKQQFEMMEALCGCEGENKYTISAANPQSESASTYPFLYAKERSECLHRICLEYYFS